jgi:glycosyltransferase involved in cell wall biosynthesis
MNVLFITVRADIGGGPEHLFQLLLHKPASVNAFVACPNDKPYRDRFESLVGRAHMTEVPHRAFSMRAFFDLARFIKTHKIDVVHSHGKGAGLYARLLRIVTGVHVVHTFHGLHIGDYGRAKRALYLGLERGLCRLTSTAICVSKGEAALIRDNALIADQKRIVIDNGVAVPNEITRPIWDGGPLRLLAVNRYDYQKNPDLLVDIAAKLKPSIPFHLDVIGTGDRIDDIRATIHTADLDDCVTIHGGVSTPRDYFRAAHVFVSTSRWEGMPLAVLEAMSEGLCVIATNVVGNNDVLRHGENGLLFETVDQAAMQLIDLTPALCATLSQQARADALDHYSAEVMAQKTYAVLTSASPSSL